ncbi:MAG: hypothetical protein V4714_01785 [Bacteroidota bacterium]
MHTEIRTGSQLPLSQELAREARVNYKQGRRYAARFARSVWLKVTAAAKDETILVEKQQKPVLKTVIE